MSGSIDRIIHDVENLKSKIFPSKFGINDSIKALYVSMDESKKKTAMLRAKREFLEQVFPPDFFRSNNEEVKMIGVSSIDSLLVILNLMIMGLKKSQLYLEGVPMIRRVKNLIFFSSKSGFEEVKTLTSDVPNLLDYKDFNYYSYSLIECIYLVQSMLHSPNADEQNKAFTKHIVEAMMKALEEKVELEISIPRKLYDEWEPTIKVKIKNYVCNA